MHGAKDPQTWSAFLETFNIVGTNHAPSQLSSPLRFSIEDLKSTASENMFWLRLWIQNVHWMFPAKKDMSLESIRNFAHVGCTFGRLQNVLNSRPDGNTPSRV